MSLVVGIPPSILNLIQEGLLERAFHDGLFPALQFRAEALAEEWPANTGEETFMSRPGLLAPVTTPTPPGEDPVPQTVSYEQWVARLLRYTGTIDTHMPTSATANANLFMRNIQQLGLQAGQSLNRIPRNELFKSYLSGHANLTSVTAAVDTQIQVSSVNGFTDLVGVGAAVRPTAVSAANPLSIAIQHTTPITVNVIGFSLDDPDDAFGPGTLQLDAAVGAIVATRSAVLSSQRPDLIRAGGGDSIDDLSAADVFTLQNVINASNQLRTHNVQPHEDGYYHAHISPGSNSQVFQDAAFQRLNTALPDHTYYHEGFIGTIGGIMFFLNNESPTNLNSGATTATGTNALYSEDIGAETVNETSIRVGRILVTGKGALYERYLNENQYISEAGVSGKIGEFDVVNAGLQIMTERIRLVLRAPTDRLQDVVASTWSISTGFPVPSDVTAGSGPQRFKRAVIIEHALG